MRAWSFSVENMFQKSERPLGSNSKGEGQNKFSLYIPLLEKQI
jgi:hypothetical protein